MAATEGQLATKASEYAAASAGLMAQIDRLKNNLDAGDVRRREEVERAQHANPRLNAIRDHLIGVMRDFENMSRQIAADDREAARRVYELEYRTEQYLENQLPEYTRFAANMRTRNDIPHASRVDLADAVARCQERLARLKEVMTILER